jgi:UDP-3-O-[3-hydroxymyristoyl] glucosamine N-acyltransferase
VPLITPIAHAAWAMTAGRLHQPRRLDPAAPAVHPSALLEAGVSVGHGAIIGEGAQIGAGTEIGPHAVIGPGVAIGRGCRIGAGATISCALIGDNVRIDAAVVIGEAGFGVTVGPKGLLDVPQLGRVIIQDGVSIGAHTCVDRGAYDDTVIGENTKIDNLVQIAHNVVVGRNCVIAGHCGLSGSCVVGDGVRMGGRVGLADHVTIGAGAQLAAAAGVMRDVPAGETWCGAPARPVLQFFREVAWVTKSAARKSGGGAA